MSHTVIVVFLFALAGFLLGGVYSTWKTTRWLAVALGICAALSVAGAITWLL